MGKEIVPWGAAGGVPGRQQPGGCAGRCDHCSGLERLAQDFERALVEF